MKYSLVAFACLTLVSTGCSTIYFHRGGTQGESSQYSDWHHDGILGLVEFSDPVDMAQKCEKGWDTIKVERSFLNGLAGSFTGLLYDPWTVSYACR